MLSRGTCTTAQLNARSQPSPKRAVQARRVTLVFVSISTACSNNHTLSLTTLATTVPVNADATRDTSTPKKAALDTGLYLTLEHSMSKHTASTPKLNSQQAKSSEKKEATLS